MSAYSTPSPFVRATSLPASACVSSGARSRWIVSGLGYALRRCVCSKRASQVTSRSASRARMSTRPRSKTPQRAQRRPTCSSRVSSARRRSACACEPSTTSTARGSRRRSSSRSIARSVSTCHDGADLGALERAFGLQLEPDRDARLPRHARADREEQGERRGDDRELRPAERERGHQADGGERRVPDEARACGSRHARGAAVTSSARGVGTVSSTSRTTSSDETRCTQSSGRRTRRCASAGTAIALTSSGSA